MYDFHQHGQSGIWLSDLLPHTAKIADEICLLRAMNTEAINHDPAITFMQTGSQLPGRPCMGSWIDYGLGSENENLPAFVVLNSLPSNGMADQGLLARLWGAGFLPSRHQGVQFRSAGDPVLDLSNPPGITREPRRGQLDTLSELNRRLQRRAGDPEIETRIAQYEMAFRMQASVPDLADTSKEPEHVLALYGEDARKPGTFAANCLLARRLAERNVRCVRTWAAAARTRKRVPARRMMNFSKTSGARGLPKHDPVAIFVQSSSDTGRRRATHLSQFRGDWSAVAVLTRRKPT
jgi:hypothetical protein